MTDVIWKEYDANYKVSSEGRVVNRYTGKVLAVACDGYGYPIVTLYKRTVKVHRMVATLFIEKPNVEAVTVNHKNGIKKDNRVENLEWLSVADNNAHAGRTGLMANGVEIHTSLLKEEDVIKIKQLFVEHKLGDTEIGKMFGANNSTISNIRRKIAWKHVLPELEYPSKSPFGRGVAKKLRAEDIPLIRKLASEGIKPMHIAIQFNVSSGTIGGILNGSTWKNY
jgi:hypothetical protein